MCQNAISHVCKLANSNTLQIPAAQCAAQIVALDTLTPQCAGSLLPCLLDAVEVVLAFTDGSSQIVSEWYHPLKLLLHRNLLRQANLQHHVFPFAKRHGDDTSSTVSRMLCCHLLGAIATVAQDMVENYLDYAINFCQDTELLVRSCMCSQIPSLIVALGDSENVERLLGELEELAADEHHSVRGAAFGSMIAVSSTPNISAVVRRRLRPHIVTCISQSFATLKDCSRGEMFISQQASMEDVRVDPSLVLSHAIGCLNVLDVNSAEAEGACNDFERTPASGFVKASSTKDPDYLACLSYLPIGESGPTINVMWRVAHACISSSCSAELAQSVVQSMPFILRAIRREFGQSAVETAISEIVFDLEANFDVQYDFVKSILDFAHASGIPAALRKLWPVYMRMLLRVGRAAVASAPTSMQAANVSPDAAFRAAWSTALQLDGNDKASSTIKSAKGETVDEDETEDDDDGNENSSALDRRTIAYRAELLLPYLDIPDDSAGDEGIKLLTLLLHQAAPLLDFVAPEADSTTSLLTPRPSPEQSKKSPSSGSNANGTSFRHRSRETCETSITRRRPSKERDHEDVSVSLSRGERRRSSKEREIDAASLLRGERRRSSKEKEVPEVTFTMGEQLHESHGQASHLLGVLIEFSESHSNRTTIMELILDTVDFIEPHLSPLVLYSHVLPLATRSITLSASSSNRRIAARIVCKLLRRIPNSTRRGAIISWLVRSLSNSPSYHLRLLFLYVCKLLLTGELGCRCSRHFFKTHGLVSVVLQIASDSVVNLRINICELLVPMKRALHLPADAATFEMFHQKITKLRIDPHNAVRKAMEAIAAELESVQTFMRSTSSIASSVVETDDDKIDSVLLAEEEALALAEKTNDVSGRSSGGSNSSKSSPRSTVNSPSRTLRSVGYVRRGYTDFRNHS